MEMPAITDDLLAEIFLRLPTPDDVASVRTACVSFRRVTSHRSFILRYRKLHRQLLLGLVDQEGFHPVLPPHPSAPAARALATSAAADFSFSFLPSPGCWAIKDAHNGRFLLYRAPGPVGEKTPACKIDNELAVCDPLHRRYLLLPPAPDHLLADRVLHPFYLSGPFLAPPAEEAVAEETSFRVIWMVRCETKPVAVVFSSCSGQWGEAGSSRSWSDVLAVKDARRFGPCLSRIKRHYAYGCFYWEVVLSDMLLVLDTLTMEFSMDRPPAGRQQSKGEMAIVEAGEGRPGFFELHYDTSGLYYAVKQDNQWQMEKTTVLDSEYLYSIAGATERYLEDRPLVSSTPDQVPDYECFSLDGRTLQLQRMCSLKQWHMSDLQMYNNFSPSRTI